METTTDFSNLEAIVESYQDLRRKCYNAAVANNGKLMGVDAWLRHALEEGDLELSPNPVSIYCWGSTFTSQTQSVEWFEFSIPISAL